MHPICFKKNLVTGKLERIVSADINRSDGYDGIGFTGRGQQCGSIGFYFQPKVMK